MSRILEKLADQHEERIINVLYTLENDIINEVTRATKGQLVSQRLAIQLQPRLRTIIQNTFLNEADLIINEEYNKVAKEVLDTFGKMPIPKKFKNLTDIDLSTINALKTQSFSGFEDIAERFLKVINDEVYQSTIAGRPFNDMVSNIKSHINGVYKTSNTREINELVDFINENKFDTAKKAQVEDAVRKLHTQYASDRAGNNLRRYASQIAHDSVMQFHGQFTVAKAKASGLNHFTYTGTLVRDSRPFCVDMLNKTLTEEQIRDMWNNRSWQGKSTGDPFIVRGGYRCRHTWIPTDPSWGEETVDEVPDEPVVEEAPTPPVVDETDIFAPINREGVTEQTIQILSTNEATKRLNKVFGDASKDDRYFNKKSNHFRGTQAKDFGKLSGAKLKDKELSMLLAIMPEIEELCKKFNIPMIRGVKGSKNTSSFIANMGDGVMGLQLQYAQFTSKKIGAKLLDRNIVNKLEDQKRKLNDEYVDLKAKRQSALNELGAEDGYDWQVLGRGTFSETGKFTRANYNKLSAEIKVFENRASAISDEIQDINKQLDNKLYEETSFWKRGDNIANRPFASGAFESNNFDQFRTTVYHEIGHHVHQTYKRKIIRENSFHFKRFGEYGYNDLERPLESRILKEDVRLTYKDTSPTRYGTTNTKEWFVENFALFYRGKEELVAPEFIKILKEIKDDLIS